MNSSTLTQALLWCTVIDYYLQLLWWVIMLLPHQLIYRLSSRGLKLTEEQFHSYNFAGIISFKLAIILFKLVPYVALRVVG